MKIGVFGTGMVGQAIAGKLVEVGQDVIIGTRDPAQTRLRSEPGLYGQASFREWLMQNQAVKLGTFAEAGRYGEALVNATRGRIRSPSSSRPEEPTWTARS